MVLILEVLSEDSLRELKRDAVREWNEHMKSINILVETIDELDVELNRRKQKED